MQPRPYKVLQPIQSTVTQHTAGGTSTMKRGHTDTDRIKRRTARTQHSSDIANCISSTPAPPDGNDTQSGGMLQNAKKFFRRSAERRTRIVSPEGEDKITHKGLRDLRQVRRRRRSKSCTRDCTIALIKGRGAPYPAFVSHGVRGLIKMRGAQDLKHARSAGAKMRGAQEKARQNHAQGTA